MDLILSSFVALAAACALATVYLWRIYQRQRKPRSRIFRMLVRSSAMKSILGAYFVYAIILRWLGLPPPPVLLSTAAILALLIPPIYFAFEIFFMRRQKGGRPPPFAEDD